MQLTQEGLIPLPPLETKSQSLLAIEKSLLGHLILLIRPRVIVELGVCEAVTTEFMCRVLIENQIDGMVVGFDLPETISRVRESNQPMRDLERSGRAMLIPGSLPNSLEAWLQEVGTKIDLALVDATHNYPSVSGELNLLWSRLAPDGYIVCDDYHSRYEGVRYAVDHFVATHPGAMAVPLISSQRSEELGIQAKLAVLRHRPYQFKELDFWLEHKWGELKTTLYGNPFIRMLWGWVRPLFRSDSG